MNLENRYNLRVDTRFLEFNDAGTAYIEKDPYSDFHVLSHLDAFRTLGIHINDAINIFL